MVNKAIRSSESVRCDRESDRAPHHEPEYLSPSQQASGSRLVSNYPKIQSVNRHTPARFGRSAAACARGSPLTGLAGGYAGVRVSSASLCQRPVHDQLHLRLLARLSDDVVHLLERLALQRAAVPFDHLVPCGHDTRRSRRRCQQRDEVVSGD